MCQWSDIVDATLRKSCILSGSKRSLKRPSPKGSWLWFAAKLSRQFGATLGLRSHTSIARAFGGLVQDLYTASKDNQAFLHARLGLGQDQLQPFKASISNWICQT